MKLFWSGLTLVNSAAIAFVVIFTFEKSKQSVVYVDSGKLVNGYLGMTDARSAYQKKAAVWKANIDTLAQEVKTQIMDYEKESRTMTAKEKKLSEELIRAKQNQLAQYQQAMNSQAQEEDNKMTTEVLTQINAYIKTYGENHGYTIILAATQYGNLAYADEGLDITDEVLEGLNKEYKGQ
jgi:outer membrane protein